MKAMIVECVINPWVRGLLATHYLNTLLNTVPCID